MKLEGNIISLVMRTHLGAACENMSLHTVLIMYLYETDGNKLWLGAR